MKLLVLGSNGFVGRNLVEQLSKGDYDILAPKRDTLDLVDQDAVEDYLKVNRPDVVINCAITITSAETNLHIYYNIERCAQYFGRLLNVGSGAEYAPKYYIPMMQESYFGKNIPGDTYGISKFCIAKDIERSTHDFINLRVFGIFGEYEDHTRRFITNNICSSIRDQSITVNRNSVFDYLDVMDFVRIVERFLTLDAKYKSYNVCTAQPQALVDLADVIDKVSQKTNTLTVVDKEVFSTYVGDNSRLLAEIGEFDFTPVDVSIRRLFDWYQAEFDAGRIN
jgi:GDP-L-fucose synthase